MPDIWKKLFIITVIILAVCITLSSLLGYFLNNTSRLLEDTRVQLLNTGIELDILKEQLTQTNILLDTAEARLVDIEAQLDTTETELNVTKEQLANLTAQLQSTRNLLYSTQSSLETELNNNSQMTGQYTSIREQINVRLALTPQIKQSYLMPGNPAISGKVQEITGGYSENITEYWRDFERLYRWVVNNISYSSDSYIPFLPETISGEFVWSKECWRTPEETLEDETGDCEDMAVLLASMLRSYNEGKYDVWVLKILSSTPEAPGHAAVAFPVTGGNLTILDPAGNYYTGYPYGTLQSESISVAVNQWLSHWRNDMPGAEIVEMFSETDSQQFSGTAEFITWSRE